MEEDPEVEQVAQIGKKEQAHLRAIAAVFPIQTGQGQLGIITIAQESLKIWRIDEDDDEIVFTEIYEVKKWRHGVQSADVSADGKRMVVLGLDSVLYQILITEEGDHVDAFDLDFMEAWHVKIEKNQKNFITASFSGMISEVTLEGRFGRRETFNNAKQISALAYSDDSTMIAAANNDGVVTLIDATTLKAVNTFEVHGLKIRTMVFTPDGEHILTGCDDKTIRLSSLVSTGNTNSNNSTVRTFCGNKSPIMCVVIDAKSSGTRFASSSQGGQVMLWHIEFVTPTHIVPTSKELPTITGLAFLANGRNLVTVGEDRQILCYRIPQSGSPPQSPRLEEPEEEQGEQEVENDENRDIHMEETGESYANEAPTSNENHVDMPMEVV